VVVTIGIGHHDARGVGGEYIDDGGWVKPTGSRAVEYGDSSVYSNDDIQDAVAVEISGLERGRRRAAGGVDGLFDESTILADSEDKKACEAAVGHENFWDAVTIQVCRKKRGRSPGCGCQLGRCESSTAQVAVDRNGI
jgi:hypothetical protein